MTTALHVLGILCLVALGLAALILCLALWMVVVPLVRASRTVFAGKPPMASGGVVEPETPEPDPPADPSPSPVVGAWTLTPTESGLIVLDLTTRSRKHAGVLQGVLARSYGLRVTVADDAPDASEGWAEG